MPSANPTITPEMDYKFELKLILDEILAKPDPAGPAGSAFQYDREELENYLVSYHREHGDFPVGLHDISIVRSHEPLTVTIDFDEVRAGIQVAFREKQRRGLSQGIESTDDLMFQIFREIVVGLREQELGRNPNDAVFKMRQRLASRLEDIEKD